MAPPTTSSSAKRKSAAAGMPSSSRPVKRRASKACQCCRSRKVRCDVVESGIPCTNCRLDEVECCVTEGKRRKKSCIEGDVLENSPVNSVEEGDELPAFPMFNDIDSLQELDANFGQPQISPRDSASLEREVNQHKPHMLCK